VRASGFAVAIDVGPHCEPPAPSWCEGARVRVLTRPWPRSPGRAARERLLSRSCLIGERDSPIGLQERAAIAQRSGAHVFVSIHHDSVQPRYLERWTFEGRAQEHTTDARGFSLFVSAANRFFAASKELAFIGSELRASRRPSVHYASQSRGRIMR
jgi:N-acetylmuramoyl-L-alanine amidase